MAHEHASIPYLVPGTTYVLDVELDGTVTGTPTYALYVNGVESVSATDGSQVSGSLYRFSVEVPSAALAGKSGRVRISATVDGSSKTIDFHSIVVTVLEKGYNLGDAGPGDTVRRILVKDESGNRVSGAEVWITDDADGQNLVVGILSSNDTGAVDVRLNSGTYYVWRAHEDYTFSNPQTLTIS